MLNKPLLSCLFALLVTVAVYPQFAQAAPPPPYLYDGHDRHDRHDRYIKHNRYEKHFRYDPWRHHKPAPPRIRHYHGIRIIRPHGRPYFGYGHYFSDADAFRFLAFTAITLTLLDQLNESQQREHEAAQIAATRADIGEKIIWHDGNASGSVTTKRIGTSTSGRECREFEQTIKIEGKSEKATGTACRNDDGSWEVID
jgi:hypothetical protein